MENIAKPGLLKIKIELPKIGKSYENLKLVSISFFKLGRLHCNQLI